MFWGSRGLLEMCLGDLRELVVESWLFFLVFLAVLGLFGEFLGGFGDPFASIFDAFSRTTEIV